MRIAINTRFLLPNKIEGIGRVTYEIVSRMVVSHPEDQFDLIFDRAYDEAYIFSDNVMGQVIGPPTRHPILTHTWLQWGLRSWLRKNRPDVYLSFDGFMPIGSEVPTVITIHDLAYQHFPAQNRWADRKYYQKKMPLFAEKSAHIITVSEFSKQDICQTFDLPESKVTSIYNGVGALYNPIDESEKTAIRQKYAQGLPYFLYVGAIHPRKNVEGLLRAFDLFKNRGDSKHKLLITGRKAWLTDSVERTLEKMDHQQDVVFTDYVPEEDLPSLIAGAYGLCYVSFFEGFGLPIVEGMACGVPVICSDRNAMQEIGGAAAILVDPTDDVHIADAMSALSKDDNLRRQKVADGLKRAHDFNWDVAAGKYYDVLRDVGTT